LQSFLTSCEQLLLVFSRLVLVFEGKRIPRMPHVMVKFVSHHLRLTLWQLAFQFKQLVLWITFYFLEELLCDGVPMCHISSSLLGFDGVRPEVVLGRGSLLLFPCVLGCDYSSVHWYYTFCAVYLCKEGDGGRGGRAKPTSCSSCSSIRKPALNEADAPPKAQHHQHRLEPSTSLQHGPAR
jgi:hypothetical protein